jgi:hypothetical protein
VRLTFEAENNLDFDLALAPLGTRAAKIRDAEMFDLNCFDDCLTTDQPYPQAIPESFRT